MLNSKNIPVLLALALAMSRADTMLGMLAPLANAMVTRHIFDCRQASALIEQTGQHTAQSIKTHMPIAQITQGLIIPNVIARLQTSAVIKHKEPHTVQDIKTHMPSGEFLKRDGEACLIWQNLKKSQNASLLLRWCQKWRSDGYGKLAPLFETMPSYAQVRDQTQRDEKEFFSWYSPTNNEEFYHIICTELKNPNYRSFFHGTSGTMRIFFDLQKKLAQQHAFKNIEHFEFLRACAGRSNLKGITAEKYVERWKCAPIHHDEEDPWQTELVSVDRSLCHARRYRDSGHGESKLYQACISALAAYNLPMPYNEYTFNKSIPRLRHGILLHILLCDNIANRLVYRARGYGYPSDIWHMPAKNNEADESRHQEYRIILDPLVFDKPNSEVQIHVHQKLTPKERTAIDQFIAQLIGDAQQLKRQNALADLDALTTTHVFKNM